MPPEIRITAEPIDNNRCKFVVSEPVLAGGVRRFAGADDAKGSPLAEAIFAIPGLDASELIVSGNIVTVVKQSAAPWQAVGKSVGLAIRAAMASDLPPLSAPPRLPNAVNDDALRSEEHTSELQSLTNLVCRLLLEKKNTHYEYSELSYTELT